MSVRFTSKPFQPKDGVSNIGESILPEEPKGGVSKTSQLGICIAQTFAISSCWQLAAQKAWRKTISITSVIDHQRLSLDRSAFLPGDINYLRYIIYAEDNLNVGACPEPSSPREGTVPRLYVDTL